MKGSRDMSARRRATNGRAVGNRDTVIKHTNTQEDDRSGGNRDIDIENTFYALRPPIVMLMGVVDELAACVRV